MSLSNSSLEMQSDPRGGHQPDRDLTKAERMCVCMFFLLGLLLAPLLIWQPRRGEAKRGLLSLSERTSIRDENFNLRRRRRPCCTSRCIRIRSLEIRDITAASSSGFFPLFGSFSHSINTTRFYGRKCVVSFIFFTADFIVRSPRNSERALNASTYTHESWIVYAETATTVEPVGRAAKRYQHMPSNSRPFDDPITLTGVRKLLPRNQVCEF